MKKWIRRAALIIVGAVFVTYMTLLGWLWLNQDSLVFAPGTTYSSYPEDAGLSHQDVDLEVDASTRIRGWFVPARESRGTILFFHGNSGTLSSYLDHIQGFARMGMDSFSIDYEGYGESGGAPSEENFYRDADAAWKWLTTTRLVNRQRIVVWGYSLGGGVAAWTASQYSPGAVVLESTFTSIPDVGARLYPWMPIHWISHTQFDSLDRVAQIETPLFVVHGTKDPLIPFEMGQELYKASRGPKHFVEFAGEHSGGFSQTSSAWSELTTFLETNSVITLSSSLAK